MCEREGGNLHPFLTSYVTGRNRIERVKSNTHSPPAQLSLPPSELGNSGPDPEPSSTTRLGRSATDGIRFELTLNDLS